MQNYHQISAVYYEKWKYKSHFDDVVMNELRLHGLDSLQIMEMIDNFKKKQENENLTNTGFLITSMGALLGFISCVLTMTDVLPEFRSFILYGLTSAAIVLITVGLYYIFE
ncbi:MAG TPA: hypothetical protein PLL99_04185 [Chitinophagales bacterium]|jgi:hypothetical protein|nr:hypothetical protein [Chitinophagales bacterium]HQG37623.1 hypothetical protein [Chitinophagales bacterium]